MGFTGFYLVLLGYTGLVLSLYWVLSGSYWVLPNFSGFYQVVLGFT